MVDSRPFFAPISESTCELDILSRSLLFLDISYLVIIFADVRERNRDIMGSSVSDTETDAREMYSNLIPLTDGLESPQPLRLPHRIAIHCSGVIVNFPPQTYTSQLIGR